ncbi:hypothetical protein [Nioella nitratireducens]|uniref:hypothetical protein n=1 Tax=Nioella nitratireducens TaxID=1287720 RepID=UPI0008FD2C02|nr:hypothetical protein [Nioella nitratireducens]
MQNFLSTLAAIIVTLIVIYVLSSYDLILGPSQDGQLTRVEFSYSDFVSVLLTAPTILLGCLGLGIAIIAFRTKNEIMEDARNTAENVAKEEAQKKLKSLPEQASEAINEAVRNDLPRALEDKLMF